jgi:hypothetical protein
LQGPWKPASADAATAEPLAFEVFAIALLGCDDVVPASLLRALWRDSKSNLAVNSANFQPLGRTRGDLQGLDASRVFGADGDRHGCGLAQLLT